MFIHFISNLFCINKSSIFDGMLKKRLTRLYQSYLTKLAKMLSFETTLHFVNVTLQNSIDQLKRMARFASYFNENEIRSQPVNQIPWNTLSRVIIQKSSS